MLSRLGLILGLCLLSVPLLAAEIGERTIEGQKYLVLKSDSLEALVAPHRGGQIVSLVYLKNGQQVGNSGALTNGLFSDHDLKQPHPGELMQATYQAERLPVAADGTVSVRVSRLAQGGWRNETLPSLAGMLYEKTYTLAPHAPVLRLTARITNQSQEDRLADYWLQSVARVGNGDRNYYFRPAPTGLSVISSDDYTVHNQFVTDPVAGWMAALSRRSRLGLVYLVDYDHLDRLYNCNTAFTQEFMYERVPLPPGKSWETSVQLRVVEDFDSVTYASGRLVADVQVAQETETLKVTHRLCAWEQPLKKVRIATALREVATQTEKAAEAIVVPTLGPETWSGSLEFDATAGGMKVLLVTVFSEAGEDRYEIPLFPFGDVTGSYRRPRPARDVRLPRPDNLEAVWQTAQTRPAGLLQVGDSPFSDQWRLAEAAQALGMAYTVSHYTPAANWRDASLHPFPLSWSDLFRYDAVVLADGDAKALRTYGCEMLADYVVHGGGVLFLGGNNSLGKGALTGTALEKLLPVETRGAWDLQRTGGATADAAAGAPAWATDPWREPGGRVDWLQATTVKPGATVWLTAAQQPLLVTAKYGRGRVAVFTGTVYVDSQAQRIGAHSLFCVAPGYAGFLKELLQWLQGEA